MSTVKSKWAVIGGGVARNVVIPSLFMAIPVLSWTAGYHSGLEGCQFPSPTPTATILVPPSNLP
jgi:hypothetical protein